MTDSTEPLPDAAITAARDALVLFVGDPDWLDDAARAAVEAAAPALRAQGAATERARIRQFAINHDAQVLVRDDPANPSHACVHWFADLLDGDDD